MRVDGCSAIVTGGASGLGLALAGCHAEAGVDTPDTSTSGSTHVEKKTTTYDDGSRTSKTEVKTQTYP